MAPKKNYTPEQMGRALDAVRMGEKISTAALRFGVPRITLHNKVTGKSPAVCAMGPQTIFTPEEEDILVKWLVAMSEKHFPINRQLLTESVQKIILDQGKANPFTNNKPGKKWFSSFLKRHPDITEKTAQNLSKSRDDVTEEGIRKWFEEITTYIEGIGLKDVLDEPSRIFNTDESAFFLSPKAGRVLCKQAEKHLYQFCGDEKDNLTVLLTANATGQLAPPMIVFKYDRLPAHITATVPEHWGIGKSESGWMCGSTFYEYITNIFNPWLEEQKIPKPFLFFLDGHRSHLTLHLSDFCSANGIELIALYPNSTHILQPMDLAVFRPLKLAWRKEVSKWQLNNLGKVLKKEHFAPVLKDAISTISEECIRNGFRAGGLHPFGPDYIDMSKIKKKHTQIIEKEVDPKQMNL
ncbi:uncharacterized protein LOC134796734 [Cydia splendana]|uniref:uncharacterized protein LOC134796734 n=1 Tax=Cydia splendana TaxID=1100963 RepID=UPI00300CE6B0